MPRDRITTIFDADDRASSVIRRVNSGVADFARFAFSPAGMVAGAVAIGTAVAGMTARYVENSAQLNRHARSAQISVESVQRLQYAWSSLGLEGDDLNSVLTELDIKAGDAINSGGDVADAFRRVGLEVEDLRGQKPDELLFLIADGLQNIENNQQRVNIVDAIFGGDDGRRILPLLQQGSDAIRDLGDEFASTGQIIDAQSAANAEVVERGMQRISAAVRGGGDRIGQFVTNLIAPAFRRIANESETQTDAAILALQDKVQEAHAAGLNFGTAMTDPVIIELRRLAEEAGVTVDTIIHEFRRGGTADRHSGSA